MKSGKRLRLGGLAGGVMASLAMMPVTASGEVSSVTAPGKGFVSRANTPPRKVTVAAAIANFSGTVEQRLALAAKLLDDGARTAALRATGRGLDLMVFPEFAICRETGRSAAERSVSLDGPVLDVLGAKAREHRTWIVIPMTLRETGASAEGGGEAQISNAAVLLDRAGAVAGIFRKVHPMVDGCNGFEGGVTPGLSYPVFTCDFGRLGILICWDMAYEEAWDALAAGGAELVALPSASPQTLRPAAQALRHHYYVVNSPPRDNASVFDPIGRTIAQVTTAPGVVVQEIDLAYAVLHWSETLQEGRAFTDRYGAKAGYGYSAREDTGVFWSNDPALSVGTMVRELGLREMPEVIEAVDAARLKAVGGK